VCTHLCGVCAGWQCHHHTCIRAALSDVGKHRPSRKQPLSPSRSLRWKTSCRLPRSDTPALFSYRAQRERGHGASTVGMTSKPDTARIDRVGEAVGGSNESVIYCRIVRRWAKVRRVGRKNYDCPVTDQVVKKFAIVRWIVAGKSVRKNQVGRRPTAPIGRSTVTT
jgi:hypothetical protein